MQAWSWLTWCNSFCSFCRDNETLYFSSRVLWREDAVKFAVLHFMLPYWASLFCFPSTLCWKSLVQNKWICHLHLTCWDKLQRRSIVEVLHVYIVICAWTNVYVPSGDVNADCEYLHLHLNLWTSASEVEHAMSQHSSRNRKGIAAILCLVLFGSARTFWSCITMEWIVLFVDF